MRHLGFSTVCKKKKKKTKSFSGIWIFSVDVLGADFINKNKACLMSSEATFIHSIIHHVSQTVKSSNSFFISTENGCKVVEAD